MAAPPPNLGRRDPLVYAVVATHNRRDQTLRFLRACAGQSCPNLRVVIADAGSTDGTTDAVRREHPGVELVDVGPDAWWAGATRAGVTHALDRGADYVLTINDDARFGPDLVQILVDTAARDPRRIVGSRLMCARNPGSVRAIGTSARFRGYDLLTLNFLSARWSDLQGRLPDPYPVDTMCGDGVLVPRQVFEQVGLYDADALPHYHADSDLILRAREAGFRPVIALSAVVEDTPPDRPRLTRFSQAILSRGSDRYAPALWRLVRRHAGRSRAGCGLLVAGQYLPYVLPQPLRERLRALRAARRASHAAAGIHPIDHQAPNGHAARDDHAASPSPTPPGPTP